MNDTTQKQAAEAWKQILAYDDGIVGKQSPQIDAACITIIQSAIEKADLVWRETAEALLKEKESRAAHASEPWEAHGSRIRIGTRSINVAHPHAANELAVEHNATLQPAHASEDDRPPPLPGKWVAVQKNPRTSRKWDVYEGGDSGYSVISDGFITESQAKEIALRHNLTVPAHASEGFSVRKVQVIDACAQIFTGLRAVTEVLRKQGAAKAKVGGEWNEGYAAMAADAVKHIESFIEDSDGNPIQPAHASEQTGKP